MKPPAFIFIRISPAGDGDDSETKNDYESLLLVQETSDPGSSTNSVIQPIFSREEYDALVNAKRNSGAPPALNRLFSFPLPENYAESAGNEPAEQQTLMASVFESTVCISEGEMHPSCKIISKEELFHITETRPSCIEQSIADHVLHLYRQKELDSRIPRRLLHGTSGSNVDEYTLRPKPEVLFLDCDDCLYFDNWHIAGHLTKKIEDHCQKEFGLPEGFAYELYKQHGTALRGLIAEGYLTEDCAIDGFLEAVHDLPIHELLTPDIQLREMLMRVDPSIRKFVFTASVSHHAQRCIDALGIADLIEGIIDVKDCELETKHSASSFRIAMKRAGVDDPEACIFVDDSVKNIEQGRRIGWRSVLVGRVGRDCGKPITSEHAELEVDRIHELPEVLPELFTK